MKKTLGQNGLNFIANKYKELKTALSYKVDNSQITDVYDAGDEERIPSSKALSELEKSLRREVDRKVYKVSGKGLSANDYTDSDKAKVDAIPANPKYTDTTYDLSKYAEKSNISRCKTKGYNTSNTWESLSTERDLEDWIGDFDKRTRELRKGSMEIEQKEFDNSNGRGIIITYKIGNIVTVIGRFNMSSDSERSNRGVTFGFTPSPKFRSYLSLETVGENCTIMANSDGEIKFVFGCVNGWSSASYMNGCVTYAVTN